MTAAPRRGRIPERLSETWGLTPEQEAAFRSLRKPVRKLVHELNSRLYPEGMRATLSVIDALVTLHRANWLPDEINRLARAAIRGFIEQIDDAVSEFGHHGEKGDEEEEKSKKGGRPGWWTEERKAELLKLCDSAPTQKEGAARWFDLWSPERFEASRGAIKIKYPSADDLQVNASRFKGKRSERRKLDLEKKIEAEESISALLERFED